MRNKRLIIAGLLVLSGTALCIVSGFVPVVLPVLVPIGVSAFSTAFAILLPRSNDSQAEDAQVNINWDDDTNENECKDNHNSFECDHYDVVRFSIEHTEVFHEENKKDGFKLKH